MLKPLIILFMLCILCNEYACAKGKRKAYHRPYNREDTLHIPENIDDCVNQLDTIMNPALKAECLTMSEEDFITVGNTALNEALTAAWYLRYRSRLTYYFSTMGIYHMQDICTIALTCYYRHLHNQPYELDKQAAAYVEYWHKTHRMPKPPELVTVPVYDPAKYRHEDKKPAAIKKAIHKPAVKKHK